MAALQNTARYYVHELVPGFADLGEGSVHRFGDTLGGVTSHVFGESPAVHFASGALRPPCQPLSFLEDVVGNRHRNLHTASITKPRGASTANVEVCRHVARAVHVGHAGEVWSIKVTSLKTVWTTILRYPAPPPTVPGKRSASRGLPAGSYAIFATVNLTQFRRPEDASAYCQLVAGNATRTAYAWLTKSSPWERLSLQLVGRLAPLRRALMARMAASLRRQPGHILERGVEAAVDKDYLGRPEVREILLESLSEAFRSGSRGAAWEMGLYVRPWGFRLEDIRTSVHLWHGERDANAPVTMGRYLATRIPECRAIFYPGEGHLHFVDRLPEILAAVCP